MTNNLSFTQLFSSGLYQECFFTCQKYIAQNPNHVNAIKYAGKSLIALDEIEDAQNYLLEVYKMNVDDYELAKDIGNLFIINKNYNFARIWYDKSLGINPNYGPAYCNLANIELLSGDTQNALNIYRKAIKVEPKLLQAYVGAASCLNILGLYDETINLLKSALRINPHIEKANELMGIAYQRTNQAAQAMDCYKNEISINNLASTSLANLGAMLLSADNIADAIIFLKQASSISTDPKIRIRLAQAYQTQSKWVEALKEYDKIDIESMNDCSLFSEYGTCLSEVSDFNQALIYFNKAIIIEPLFFEAWVNKGITLFKLGRLKEAQQAIEKALDINPSDYLACRTMAFIYKSMGDFQKAKTYTLLSLDLNPENSATYTQLASIYRHMGLFDDSLSMISRALEIQPINPEALLSLSSLYYDLGQFDEALQVAEQALSYKPNYSEALINLGHIYKELGDLEKSLELTLKSASSNPSNPVTYLNLGAIYEELGDLDRAVASTITSIELQSINQAAISNLNRYVKEIQITNSNIDMLSQAYGILLESSYIFHDKLNLIFVNLYLHYFHAAISKLPIISKDNIGLNAIADNSCILKSLTLLIPAHPEIEAVLTLLRKELLIFASTHNTIPSHLQGFVNVLAIQCYLNEFAYAQPEDELDLLKVLVSRVKAADSNLSALLPIIACYIPLHKVIRYPDNHEQCLSLQHYGQDLFTIQVKEPLQEIKIAESLQNSSDIQNQVSNNVRLMYEENPYPRYRYADYTSPSIAQKASFFITKESSKKDLAFTECLSKASSSPHLLIAGCGTGQQVIHASRYKNAQITAIDLSANSLAYAIRKSKEYEMDAIDFRKMDILNVADIGSKFDIIECKGVLHHMSDPNEGLAALTCQLNSGGYIKIGLYSELARSLVLKARSHISKLSLKPTASGIREFRKMVINKKLDDLSDIMLWARDFYSLSECRDMCFHVQEHRFCMESLKKLLSDNGLIFCGFIIPTSIQKAYLESYPLDSEMTNFDCWQTFEAKYPITFSETYQFWAYKPI